MEQTDRHKVLEFLQKSLRLTDLELIDYDLELGEKANGITSDELSVRIMRKCQILGDHKELELIKYLAENFNDRKGYGTVKAVYKSQ